MDVDAPNFRAGSLIGAIVGAAAALALTAMSLWLARRKNQVKRLKSERDQLRKAVSKPADE
jgi:gas vesicle protein